MCIVPATRKRFLSRENDGNLLYGVVRYRNAAELGFSISLLMASKVGKCVLDSVMYRRKNVYTIDNSVYMCKELYTS